MKKTTPREKIHEALSAVADERVIMSDNSAEVYSSDKNKKYVVDWNDNTYSSNDNATFWQGYAGYPIIAILIIQGKIKYDDNINKYFKNINWKQLNKQYKNDYSKAVEYIYEELKKDNVDVNSIEKEIDSIYKQLEELDISIKRSKLFPPK